MGYDRGDSFHFDFEKNGIPFSSKSKIRLSPRSYPIQFERKWKSIFLSVDNLVRRQSQKAIECDSISQGNLLRILLTETKFGLYMNFFY